MKDCGPDLENVLFIGCSIDPERAVISVLKLDNRLQLSFPIWHVLGDQFLWKPFSVLLPTRGKMLEFGEKIETILRPLYVLDFPLGIVLPCSPTSLRLTPS